MNEININTVIEVRWQSECYPVSMFTKYVYQMQDGNKIPVLGYGTTFLTFIPP